MNLTFTRTRHQTLQGAAPDGTVLFSIAQSTSRTSEAVHVKAEPPGMDNFSVEAPDGCSKWSPETNTKAMEAAADALQEWAAKVLGVALTVNVVDNT